MNARTCSTRTHASVPCIALASLALAACSPDPAPRQADASPSAPRVDAALADEPECTNEPRTDANDKRPRCEGPGAGTQPPHAYRIVVGGGDPVDQVVCDIGKTFVLDGKLFGTEFSGGMDGTYRMVRTPNAPGVQWKASGTYHITLPDGPGQPGTLSIRAVEATTRAVGAIDENAGYTDTFTLTPAEACTQ